MLRVVGCDATAPTHASGAGAPVVGSSSRSDGYGVDAPPRAWSCGVRAPLGGGAPYLFRGSLGVRVSNKPHRLEVERDGPNRSASMRSVRQKLEIYSHLAKETPPRLTTITPGSGVRRALVLIRAVARGRSPSLSAVRSPARPWQHPVFGSRVRDGNPGSAAPPIPTPPAACTRVRHVPRGVCPRSQPHHGAAVDAMRLQIAGRARLAGIKKGGC